MSQIISIGYAVPEFVHQQRDIISFMETVYAPDDKQKRALRYLYHKGGIDKRYSVIPDYSLPASLWQFYPPTENLEPFPGLELRMEWYQRHAATLSVRAIRECLGDHDPHSITHLITVSCTGMSAPGLDLEIIEQMQLSPNIHRSSVNFMGCYAAIHGMKIADAFCKADPSARVIVVCTELCTLHFQKEWSQDNITSSMLFGDGSAAIMITGHRPGENQNKLSIDHFYSQISPKGKPDMAWQLSSTGFLMTLSSYIADMIEEDFKGIVSNALAAQHLEVGDIDHWCIHPGGRKILEAVHRSLGFTNGQLDASYEILKNFGNMSSATILFVLKKMMDEEKWRKGERVFGAAFGPGLTMETFIITV